MSGVTVQARAKLNLSLDVLGKRPDGYHELRMVMQSSGLCDEVYVELRESGYFMAETNRKYIPSGEKNEAVKAARAFFAAAGLDRGAYIRIEKRIPVCAGLGGGSADAAAVLRALNALTGANFGAERLREIAAQVGSDVPFCVEGGTALVTGRGEEVQALSPLPGCAVVVCMPHFTCSTPELFERIDSRASACRPDTAGLLAALEAGDLRGVARRMYNVFEDALERRGARAVAEIKGALLDNGALGAVMSGSGSAVFGLFASDEAAARAACGAKPLCRDVFLTRAEPAYENLGSG